MGDYDLAERGFLELLRLQGTSEWQKARCHVYLASIQTRNDRAERARTALNMYRGFLRKWPEDERCITMVREAELLVKRVLAEIEWQNAVGQSLGTKKGCVVMSGGLGDGHAGARLDTIVEGESEGGGEVETYATPPNIPSPKEEEEQQVGFVAGVVGKVAAFLGLKRRREEDDDGEAERGSKGLRRLRIA
jgi:hypothetical protein